MSKPALLAVDDDLQVLAAVRRDLISRYGGDYRIVGATSGAEALDLVGELRKRGDEIAAFVVDQRMPGMSGTEFLIEASVQFPAARKVLLTAYADTEAAIQSINEVGLDHYLMKPWDPPEESLYPVLDDLLGDWVAGYQPSFEGVRVVGARWAPRSHEIKEFLARNQIPYRFHDVDSDAEASSLLTAADSPTLPAVFLPSGDVLADPDPRMLAAGVGLHIEASGDFYDLIVIGAGPAGLAASVYGASEGLAIAVVEKEATGGQAGMSARIENYLGFPSGISGSDLARRATAQARRFGAEILNAEVGKVLVGDWGRGVVLGDGTEIRSHTIIVASGMTLRQLNVPGYGRLNGAGVFYGATVSEAAEYRDADVFVIGGANSAGQAAMMFSRFARHVVLVARGDTLGSKMSSYLVDQVASTPNIEVLTGTEVVDVGGETHLEEVTLLDRASGERMTRVAGGLFLFVGAVPHTDFLAGVVTLNDQGFVVTGPDLAPPGELPAGWPLERSPYLMETSVPGIFAAGDVRHGAIRRVASAVGQGSIAISFVHRYLEYG